MITSTDEICDLFISRGVVPHLIHLTELKEPEEVHILLYILCFQSVLSDHTAKWEGACLCS